MNREPEWLLESAVVAIQGMLIAEHGGAPGIRDRGLLESALARPRNLYVYATSPPSLFELAAAYAHGLIRNHGFVDGNKRIALLAALTFLEIHGFSLEAERPETYRMTLQLAAGEIEEAEFGAWLAERCRPASPAAKGVDLLGPSLPIRRPPLPYRPEFTNSHPNRPLMHRWPRVTSWSSGEVTLTIFSSWTWTVSVQPTPQ